MWHGKMRQLNLGVGPKVHTVSLRNKSFNISNHVVQSNFICVFYSSSKEDNEDDEEDDEDQKDLDHEPAIRRNRLEIFQDFSVRCLYV